MGGWNPSRYSGDPSFISLIGRALEMWKYESADHEREKRDKRCLYSSISISHPGEDMNI